MAETKLVLQSTGRQISAEIYVRMKSLYAPLQRGRPFDDVVIERDLSYGSHQRQRVDVYTARDVDEQPRDVLVFVPGGGFVSGDKHEADGPFYDNVGVWAARNGLVGVVANYRLAPDHVWPAGAADVALAVDWVSANINRHGGNRGRIFVMGHSAGAAHVAGFAGGLARDGEVAVPNIAGLICVSGIYDLRVDPINVAYFGDDPARHAERTPLLGLKCSEIPLLLVVAEYDPLFIQKHLLGLLNARLNAGLPVPALVRLDLHNHFSAVLHVNSEDTSLGDALLKFRKSVGTGLTSALSRTNDRVAS